MNAATPNMAASLVAADQFIAREGNAFPHAGMLITGITYAELEALLSVAYDERDAARSAYSLACSAAEELIAQRDAARSAADSAAEEFRRMGLKWAEASAERDAAHAAIAGAVELCRQRIAHGPAVVTVPEILAALGAQS